MDKIRITIIGTGNMGGAIANALSEDSRYSVSIYNEPIEIAENVAKGRKMDVLTSLEDMDKADVVLIAIKPQTLPSMYNAIRNLNTRLIISIAAGVSLKTLEENISEKTPIVRFMPNIAAKTRSAVTAVAFQKNADEEEKKLALDIASSFGSAFELDEKLFPAFIGISGSAIAYVFEFMHQLAMGGVREGIPYDRSLQIVRDTMISATSLQKSTGLGAIDLETMVCSAAGTTIEGIKALDDGNFASAVVNSVSAAANKSRELEKKA